MPYENIPTENAPALSEHGAYEFRIDLNRATIDDLDLFDAGSKTGNREMLDFLDRVVADVSLNGVSLGARVRGHSVPYPRLKQLMESVGEAMKQANDAGN
jgi:hypothetical protein